MSPPHYTAALLLTFFFITTTTTALAHICSNPPPEHCPPFTTTTPPPFPFSFTPGCGHPNFQLHCPNSTTSNPSRAAISINNLLFSLIQYTPNSLTLSPVSTATTPPNSSTCSSSSSLTLHHPISLSPFQISESSCSRLSLLKPCPPPLLPNCTLCPFQCKLVKNPLHLLRECSSTRRHDDDFQHECQRDVIGVIDSIVKLGFEVEWDENDSNDTYFSRCKSCHGYCGFNSSDPSKPFICYSNSSSSSLPRVKQKSPNMIAISVILFLLLCFFIALSIGTILFRSKRKRLMLGEEDPTIIFLRRHRSASLLPPVFTYEELDSSTNGFDQKRKIGDGGFGSVYLGQLHDGRFVAVKHLHKQNSGTRGGSEEKGFSTKAFCNEILILSSIEHSNLVKLHGYCSDPRGLLLVYDYVPNGTLADHLHGKHCVYRKAALRWSTRVDIALQIAMAIEYLHFSVVPPVVHRDITSSNIFVEKDMRVKVGDFGLSRLLVCTEPPVAVNDTSDGVWTGPQGTPGYLDPDYYHSFRLNEKSDVYSFGVVLLELITGKRPVDQNREKRELTLVDMVVPRIQMGLLHQVVDPVLLVDGEAMEGALAVAELAFRCLAADKDDRPDAKEVVEELRRIKGGRRGSGLLKVSNSGNVVVPDGIGGGLIV